MNETRASGPGTSAEVFRTRHLVQPVELDSAPGRTCGCSRRRSARPLKIGSLRPGIVLYDEAHPLGDDIGAIQAFDVSRKPDMLVIMGTSLKVHGLRKLVRDFAKAVHASAPPDLSAKKSMAGKVIFVNKTPPGSEWNGIIDYHIEGETDAWAHKVEEDWRRTRPSDWEVQQTLDDDSNAFKAMKDVVGKGIRKYLSLHSPSTS